MFFNCTKYQTCFLIFAKNNIYPTMLKISWLFSFSTFYYSFPLSLIAYLFFIKNVVTYMHNDKFKHCEIPVENSCIGLSFTLKKGIILINQSTFYLKYTLLSTWVINPIVKGWFQNTKWDPSCKFNFGWINYLILQRYIIS